MSSKIKGNHKHYTGLLVGIIYIEMLYFIGWLVSAYLDVCLHTAAVTIDHQVGELEITYNLLFHSNLQTHALAQSNLSGN